MKILITGGEGFIAHHVRRRLVNHEIVSVDCMEPRVHGTQPSKTPTWRWLAGDCPPLVFREVDVLIHLAAQVGVADSMDDPCRYLLDNTLDTLYLCEVLRDLDCRPKRIVVASSMSVYGDPRTQEPIAEDFPVEPASIYGLTKYDQERMMLMYGELLGIPTAALRFFNVYGPEQALTNPYTGVLAIFASAFLAGKKPTIYDDGLQTRDFVYVGDVANAVARLATIEMEEHGVYNVCTTKPTSILDVANLLMRGLDSDVGVNIPGIQRPGDIRHCIGDNTKLQHALPGWSARSLEEGITRYVEWLR